MAGVSGPSRKDGATSPKGPRADRSEEFAALFRQSSRVLWLVAVGIVGDATLADDVVQEAAVVAFRKFDQFTPGTNFAAWMAQTVRFVALNEARREHRRAAISLDDSSPDHNGRGPVLPARPGQDAAPRASAGDGEFAGRVRQALEGVSPMARACLLLRTLDGLEYSQISTLLGIPEGTAMSHVHRTRQFLRDRLASSNPAADHGRKGGR